MTKRVNGKKKGSGFELLIAKRLSSWWGEEFHRTPASGGLHWQRDNRVSGDIVTPEGSNFVFNIECKKHEGWNFEQILKNTGEVADWWAQCSRDAEHVHKLPLLIFSKNRSPVYFMMPRSMYYSVPFSMEARYFITEMKWESIQGIETRQVVAIGFLDDLVSISKEEIIEGASKI